MFTRHCQSISFVLSVLLSGQQYMNFLTLGVYKRWISQLVFTYDKTFLLVPVWNYEWVFFVAVTGYSEQQAQYWHADSQVEPKPKHQIDRKEKFLPANGDVLGKEIFLQELFFSFQALVLRLNGWNMDFTGELQSGWTIRFKYSSPSVKQ